MSWTIAATFHGGHYDGRVEPLDVDGEPPTLLFAALPTPPEVWAAAESLDDLPRWPVQQEYERSSVTRLDITAAEAAMRGIPEHRVVAADYVYARTS